MGGGKNWKIIREGRGALMRDKPIRPAHQESWSVRSWLTKRRLSLLWVVAWQSSDPSPLPPQTPTSARHHHFRLDLFNNHCPTSLRIVHFPTRNPTRSRLRTLSLPIHLLFSTPHPPKCLQISGKPDCLSTSQALFACPRKLKSRPSIPSPSPYPLHLAIKLQ